VGCTPGLNVLDPIIYDDNRNIEGDCNEATTTPPPRPPKRCKHRHP